jgi:Trk K+ transport system NAD-binding subunit
MCRHELQGCAREDFLEDASLLLTDNFAVDYALCPEQVITDYIRRLIEFPEALQVLNFAPRTSQSRRGQGL